MVASRVEIRRVSAPSTQPGASAQASTQAQAAEAETMLIVELDAAGKPLLIARQKEAGKDGAKPPAGPPAEPSVLPALKAPAKNGAAPVVMGSADAKAAGQAKQGTGPAPAGASSLLYRRFRYDNQGRLVESLESEGESAKGDEEGIRRLRSYDDEGRLSLLRTFEKGKLVHSLRIDYEGGGLAARFFLEAPPAESATPALAAAGAGAGRPGSGSRIGGGSISFVQGCPTLLPASILLLSASGEPAGEWRFDYDAASRLVACSVSAAEGKDPGSAGSGGEPTAAVGARPSEQGKTALKPAALNPAASEPASLEPASLEPASLDLSTLDLSALLGPPWPLDTGDAGGGGALFPSGLLAPPFALPTEGRVEFDYDAAGRLCRARRFGPSDVLQDEFLYRYDERGLLVEEERREGGESSLVVHRYEFDAEGRWKGRASFTRSLSYGAVEDLPFETLTRRLSGRSR